MIINFCLLVFILAALYKIIGMMNPCLLSPLYDAISTKQPTQKTAVKPKHPSKALSLQPITIRQIMKPCRVDTDRQPLPHKRINKRAA